MKNVRDLAPGALALVSILAVGCASERTATDTGVRTAGGEVIRATNPYEDSSHAKTFSRVAGDIAEDIIAQFGETATIGVLPPVFWGKDAQEPVVTVWSERIGESLADALADRRESGGVLGPGDLALSLDDLGLQPMALTSSRGVHDTGDLLGVDVVVTGTIRYEQGYGQTDEYFGYEFRAAQVQNKRSVTKDVRLLVDRESWDRSATMSADWTPAAAFGYSPASTLNEELRRAYRTLANRGTILAHRWFGNGADREDLSDLRAGRDLIAAAIELNPDAHFGRERYQLLFMDWLLDPPPEFDELTSTKISSPLRRVLPPDRTRLWLGSQAFENAGYGDAADGLAGLISLGAAWESFDVFYALF